MVVMAMLVVVVVVGCNGLKREWKGFGGGSERGTIGRIPINILLPVKLPHFVTLLRSVSLNSA